MPTARAPRCSTVPSRCAKHLAHDWCDRQRCLGWVAALRADPALVGGERRAVGDRLLGPAPPFGEVDTEVGQREQSRGRVENELREIGRAFASEGCYGLADLERVPDRSAERLVHVGEEAHDLAIRALAEVDHLLGKDAASSRVFMKAPSPTLTSSTIASAPAASFFDMIEEAISGTMSTVAVTSRNA